eukprot:TRINITY_DN1660_c0_g1_i1.p1 TRINITY_DN1660_c0_g1~~TRINITY_DN1660_c0_g1_i1.p1  ORF type:complete len:247 (-),score=16.77 TRINITY_DN1660_c0_g1_i1:238-978(-)
MAMKSFCRSLFRFLFVIFNVLAALMGFVIIVLGIVAVVSSRYLYIANYGWYGVPAFLIVMGLVLMAFAVFGIIGAGFDIKCILFFYALGLIACIVLIFITCIAGFIWSGILDSGIRDALQPNINKTDYSQLVDEIQKIEKCCGVNNYTDWFHTQWANNKTTNGVAVPESCCKDTNNCDHGILSVLNVDDIYTVGCYVKLAGYVNEYYYGFIIVILMFGLSLIIGEVVTWYLLFSGPSRNQNKYETV